MTLNRLQITIGLLLGAALISGPVKAEEVSRMIARVNNEMITSQDLDAYCHYMKYRNPEVEITDELRKEVLQRLIEDKLILSQAREEISEVPVRWLKNKLDELIESYPSYEAFEQSLAQEGLTVTALKEKLRVQYLTQNIVEKNVRSRIEVSPQEITQYYNEHKLDFVISRECVLWVGKAKSGEVFEELIARLEQASIEDAGAGEFNVSRLEVKESSLKPEIKTIVRDLGRGDYKVENIEGVYYFVYVEDITPFSLIPIEEAKEKIFSFLWDRKFKKTFSEWLKNLKEKAVIKMYE